MVGARRQLRRTHNARRMPAVLDGPENLDGRRQVGQHACRMLERVVLHRRMSAARVAGVGTAPVGGMPGGRPGGMPVIRNHGVAAASTAASLFPRPMMSEFVARRWEGLVRRLIVVTCLALGAGGLGGCAGTADCSGGVYGGGCLSAAGGSPAATTPVASSNVAPVGVAPVSAGSASMAPANVTPPAATRAAVGLGDPSTFTAVDDQQCKSYGLTFGTWDYAQCRIRLSAQHRGLDPNIGAPPPAAGNR